MSTEPATWSAMRGVKASVPDHVVFRDLAHEAVILNVQSGEFHSVDKVGMRFFAVMREVPRLEVAVPILAEEFCQSTSVIEADLAAFAQQLADSGLISLEPGE